MKSLSERLAFARGLSGLSASRLGLVSGLSRGAVGMVESGQRTNPEVDTIKAVARTLGVTTDWLLLGGVGAPTKESVAVAVKKAERRFKRASDRSDSKQAIGRT